MLWREHSREEEEEHTLVFLLLYNSTQTAPILSMDTSASSISVHVGVNIGTVMKLHQRRV